jgi:predicted DNA-binding ribbon-helix-helix protein
MKTAVIKRSIVIAGHKTSVSLENEFWEGLRDIAKCKSISVSALAEQIDRVRNSNNLSSAIRVYVFTDFRRRASSHNFEPVEQRFADHNALAI